MANDRIWIKCDKCGERGLLYKYYMNKDGYVWRDAEAFINDHLHRCYDNPVIIPTNALTFEQEKRDIKHTILEALSGKKPRKRRK